MHFETIHIIELAAAILLLYATYRALKGFKLVIWRQGWYVIAATGINLVLIELLELLIPGLEEGLIIEIMDTLTIVLFAVGIFMLSRASAKLWGKR
ncbi:MAG: hypothetical protein ACE5J7_05255 [Candidatus Aenigmatarchaeota archaeon]